MSCMFSQQSSVCRAGLHAGVIDNDGGWMDVTRQGRKDFFIKSYKNGVQSLGYKCFINQEVMLASIEPDDQLTLTQTLR